MRRRTVLAGMTGLPVAGLVAGAQPAAADATADMAALLTAPRPRMLVGAAVGSNADPSALEKLAGRPLGVRRTFWGLPPSSAAMSVARADIKAGRQPLMSFKIGKWADAAAGKHDAAFKTLGNQLAALAGTSWVILHHEPERDEPDMSLFKKAVARLIPLVRHKNVKPGIVLVGWNQLYVDAPDLKLDYLVPTTGTAKPDFVGFDTYNSFGTPWNGKPRTDFPRQWTKLRERYYHPLSAWCLPKGIAWGVAETGLSDYAYNSQALGKRWFHDQLVDASAYGASFWSYFSSGLNSSVDWTLKGEKAKAWAEMMRLA